MTRLSQEVGGGGAGGGHILPWRAIKITTGVAVGGVFFFFARKRSRQGAYLKISDK